MQRLVFSALTASLALFAARSAADTSIVAPGGPGQGALSVTASTAGIRARVCASASGCTSDRGPALSAVTADVTPLLGGARMRVIDIEKKQQIVRIDVPGNEPGAVWTMLLAAPAGPFDMVTPFVVWSGWTGVFKGEYGEAKSNVIVEDAGAAGTRIVIGVQRDDVTLCGRPTVVAPRAIDPTTLELVRGASVRNLDEAARKAAPRLFATRMQSDAPVPAAPLLRATAASSAVGKQLAALTDGDPETAWSEAKKGTGAGELVSMSSASEVPIVGFVLTVRPTEDVPGGAAPRTFYLATTDRLFHVTMPEDAWSKPGARYVVTLAEPAQTSCVALVLDEAYVGVGKDDPRVTVAELAAQTAFDGTSAEGLAGALAGGGDRAKAAAALLSRGGEAATKATIAAYGALDDAGKSLALDVIEAAPCAQQVGFFAALLASGSLDRADEKGALPDQVADREAKRAQDRLRRCGRAAAPMLADLVRGGEGPAQIAAARELSLLAPDAAVDVLLEAMPKASDATRRELRAALSVAAKRERAFPALSEALAIERFRQMPEVARIDLLRALGASAPKVDGSREAFADLAQKQAEFRVRYLLLGPAADLARAGDARAEGFLRASLRGSDETDPHVRARAASEAKDVPALVSDLVAAVSDADPRVRQAAIEALSRAPSLAPPHQAKLEGALVRLVADDPWTFIRTGSAEALASLPASPAADGALSKAVSDVSPEVRRRAIDALGAHRAVAYAEQVRERAADPREVLEVRARAILALSLMCDHTSVDRWTELARRAVSPNSEVDRRLGSAAIAALGTLHPADLEARLAPLLAKDAPQGARERAKAALSEMGECGR